MAQKSSKMVIFGINLPPKGYIPLSNFYKILLGEGAQDRTFMPNFIIVALKCGPMAPKSPKMAIFGKNLPLGENSGG